MPCGCGHPRPGLASSLEAPKLAQPMPLPATSSWAQLSRRRRGQARRRGPHSSSVTRGTQHGLKVGPARYVVKRLWVARRKGCSSRHRYPVHDLDARLAETRTRIARLVQALAGGNDDLPSVRAALVDLEREAQRLERSLQAARARAGDAAAARIDAIAQALVLGQVAGVLREGEPEERKRVVRCFVQGIRIEKATRQAVLRWYRLPRGSFVKLVELRGVEPLTPRLPALCSPN